MKCGPKRTVGGFKELGLRTRILALTLATTHTDRHLQSGWGRDVSKKGGLKENWTPSLGTLGPSLLEGRAPRYWMGPGRTLPPPRGGLTRRGSKGRPGLPILGDVEVTGAEGFAQKFGYGEGEDQTGPRGRGTAQEGFYFSRTVRGVQL